MTCWTIPENITVGHLLRALEGSFAPVECVDEGLADNCDMKDNCPTRFLWQTIKDKIEDTVDSITLEDLLN